MIYNIPSLKDKNGDGLLNLDEFIEYKRQLFQKSKQMNGIDLQMISDEFLEHEYSIINQLCPKHEGVR